VLNTSSVCCIIFRMHCPISKVKLFDISWPTDERSSWMSAFLETILLKTLSRDGCWTKEPPFAKWVCSPRHASPQLNAPRPPNPHAPIAADAWNDAYPEQWKLAQCHCEVCQVSFGAGHLVSSAKELKRIVVESKQALNVVSSSWAPKRLNAV